MDRHRIVEPRLETPPPSGHDHTAVTRLPDPLVSELVQRLGVCAAVGAGLWTYGLIMDTIVRPLAVAATVPAANVVIEIVAILTSTLLFVYVRYARPAASKKIDAGLVYFVLNAVAVALINTWTLPVIVDSSVRLSWNTVVILIWAMIMPACCPRKVLLASFVAASTDPLAMWVAHARGLASPSVASTVVYFMPNYACAVVAALPSSLFHRLGRRLRQAEEMGSYHLVELLGRGGMGEVWRARHRFLARHAAIKLIRPELLGAGTETEARDMLVRFQREAQATAALSSPHTIRVFDYGATSDRTFYYVMELLAGRDLKSLVREFGPVPAERALFLLAQACHSLAEAHACGLVHRDITPANIYVCRMGLDYDFVKVLDFGLVKLNERTPLPQTFLTGARQKTAGTPAFMAPEMIMGGEVDERADVYALGCVAYYLLTGQPVFEADTPMKMFVQHLQASPVPPSLRTELPIPRDVEDLVLACLEKDPSHRPQNAAELLVRLRRCRTRETWDNERAREWWERHLVELTGPRTVVDAPMLECAVA